MNLLNAPLSLRYLVEKTDISVIDNNGGRVYPPFDNNGCTRLFRCRRKEVHNTSIVHEANRCRRSHLRRSPGEATRTSHAHEKVIVARRRKKGLKTAASRKTAVRHFQFFLPRMGPAHAWRRVSFQALNAVKKIFLK